MFCLLTVAFMHKQRVYKRLSNDHSRKYFSSVLLRRTLTKAPRSVRSLELTQKPAETTFHSRSRDSFNVLFVCRIYASLPTTMSANVFPVSYYEDLLPKLVAVLELTQQPAGTSTPESKQRLLQAVCIMPINTSVRRALTHFFASADKQFQKRTRTSERIRKQPPRRGTAH